MPLNKPELLALNQENFPDNTQQLITPELLREFNGQMIGSMELTQSMDNYANLATANIFYGGNQSIAKEYKLFTNGVYWNNNTAGYNNLEIINSITGNIDIAALGGGVRIVSSSLNITNGTFTASLAEGFTYVGNGSGRTSLVATSSFGSTINTGSFVSTSSFNAYTQSTNIRLNNLESTSASVNISISNLNSTTSSFATSITNLNTATASLFTSASLGLTTASFSGNTLTFTKGDTSTFGVVIPDISGSTIPQGTVSSSAQIVAYNVFATTGSNNFKGSQNISSSANIGDYLGTDYVFISQNGITLNNAIQTNIAFTAANNFFNAGGNFFLQNTLGGIGSGSITMTANNGGNISVSGSQTNIAGVNFIPFSASLDSRINAITGSSINTGSFATTGSNTFTGNQTISTAGNSQLTLTASAGFQTNVEFRSENSNFQAYGDFRVNNNGQFGGSGSIKFTTSRNFMELAADSGIKIGATNGGGNGIDAGNISMQVRSGSLSLAPAANSNTTSSLLHLSSSSNTAFVNLIWKNSDNTNDTIISGSNNIFTNPGALTAGFKRYIGGNGNIIFAAGAVPQITGSMGYSPTMAQNYIGGAGGMIMRGPVSGAAWTISNNLINNTSAWAIGSTIALHAQQIVSGLTMSNNGGSVFPNIQAYKTPLSASFTYSTSTGAGTVVINCHSSSINYGGNASFGGTTINNSYFPVTSSINSTNGFVTVQSTQFIGGNNIFFSGSSSTIFTQPRALSNSIIVGYNSASLNLLSDSGSIAGLAMFGASLGVTGSNSFQLTAGIPNDYGSMFVGRNNAQDGGRAETAKNVFVVGTGTAAVKKTGFLIDSGSNTYVEGTLNVSGSTVFTGSVKVAPTFQLNLPTGSNQQVGTAVLDNASPSTVVVSNTLVTANSIIMVSKQTLTNGHSVAVSSKGAGTFTIQSTGNGDSDTVGYVIWNNT